MVLQFVREQYPRARFQRIYDATTDGWHADDFHRCCDKKGWTLTIVKTTKKFVLFGSSYIFGGFTTAEWESPYSYIRKPCPHSFLFSVNEGSKYPITSGDTKAIWCYRDCCAGFGTGGNELCIWTDSNNNTLSYCNANGASFNLPAAKGSKEPSINGGEHSFKLKQFEVY
jgi:hypothetical protein